MADCCSAGCATEQAVTDPRYRRILWIALVINAVMFFVEMGLGFKAESTALLADAVDFLGDTGNYGMSLFVLGMAPLWRPRAALIKGVTMGTYGSFVLVKAAWAMALGATPEPIAMSAIGMLALAANGVVAALLFAYRQGDANMQSVWLCTRNDMIGNVAVVLAAIGVFGTGSGWPDVAVAVAMGSLGLLAARTVIVQARKELRQTKLA